MALMTEEWASLWYQCLTQNIDYSLYCNARDSGNEAQCVAYEARFDKVRDIYDDFGTLDGWPDAGLQSALWREWFEPRRHLFLVEPRTIADPASYTARAGYALVEVPLHADVGVTRAAVAAYVDAQYAKPDLVHASAPKYVLREAGARPAHGIQQVRQACRSVVRSYRYDPETFEELRHREAVAAFIRAEIDNMGWTLDPKARDELAATGKLSEQRLESFRVMLDRCRRDFKAFAANTIRASFPDDRPFESAVLDMF